MTRFDLGFFETIKVIFIIVQCCNNSIDGSWLFLVRIIHSHAVSGSQLAA